MIVISLLLIIIATLILLFVSKFILQPWISVNSYKKRERVSTYFFPFLGIFHPCFQAVKQKGDFMAFSKESSKILPNQKYMVSNLFHYTAFYLRDTEYFRDFMQRPNLYHKSDLMILSLPLAGRGLVFTEGETWKRHRKIISNSFHFDFIKSNIGLIQDTTKEFFDKLTSSDYKNYEAIPKIQMITGEIVGRIFFGEHLNDYKIQGKPLTVELADLITGLGKIAKSPLTMLVGEKILDFPLFPNYNKLKKRIIAFRKLCFDIIQDKRTKGSKTNDLLSSLLASQKLGDPELSFSDEDIVNEFITFSVAGMDTTGHLTALALYNLSQYPQDLKEVEEEMKITYNTEEKITTDMLGKMDVLHSVLKETLRFYPPGPFNFFRKALKDHKILDLEIKKGQFVTTDYTYVFFDEKHFPNPDQFDPSRWRDPNQKLDPYAFTPFSAGPRNCIGQHLAIMEAKIIISEFLQRFEYKLKDGYEFRMTLRFLYEPQDEIEFSLTPRNSQKEKNIKSTRRFIEA